MRCKFSVRRLEDRRSNMGLLLCCAHFVLCKSLVLTFSPFPRLSCKVCPHLPGSKDIYAIYHITYIICLLCTDVFSVNDHGFCFSAEFFNKCNTVFHWVVTRCFNLSGGRLFSSYSFYQFYRSLLVD